MWISRRRLEADMARWREAGWVSGDGAAAIRQDLLRARGPGLAGALGILAAVLLGFAAMSFVAANWQDMSRIARLALLFAGLWAAYGVAGGFLARGMDVFGHAATLFGASLFGASIMLISQMFHIDGNPPDAVLAWALGTLVAGVLIGSNPTLALAMVLMSVWNVMEHWGSSTVHWPFLIGWAAVMSAFVWRRWVPGYNLGGLALGLFAVSLGYILNRGHAHELVVLVGGAGLLAAIGGERLAPRLDPLWALTLTYSFLTAFAGLYAIQFIEELWHASPEQTLRLSIAAALAIALALGAIAWGFRSGDRRLLWLGYIGFSVEILTLYFRTVGTLLGSSLFFLTAGIIVAALAGIAWKIHVREDMALEPRS